MWLCSKFPADSGTWTAQDNEKYQFFFHTYFLSIFHYCMYSFYQETFHLLMGSKKGDNEKITESKVFY